MQSSRVRVAVVTARHKAFAQGDIILRKLKQRAEILWKVGYTI